MSRSVEDTPTGPTPIDWATLLATAGRLGVKVWRRDAHGGITEVTNPPPEGDRGHTSSGDKGVGRHPKSGRHSPGDAP